ncbi:transmembrane amino acid transporter protein-domain-containing protein [Choanephora cucurbitarum]|nr:transmembrane amino acid transporter protein-domain-containing protein [Choanephora cucurbitarum]
MFGPESLRVPSNTHPHHIQSTNTNTLDQVNEDDHFYSAYGTPVSRTQSIRSTFENFAGSYSRASVLYVADVISHSSSLDHDHLEDEERSFYKSKTNDSMKDTYDGTYRTMSQPPGLVYFEPLSRHTTVGSIISQQFVSADKPSYGKSSFVQSVFNAVNVLVGVGILALPLSMRLAGWVYGSLIFLFCSLATNYTAKVIVKCLSVHDHAVTYGDMGQVAFGEKGRKLINTIFVIELITIGVALIVLLGDGLQSLFPHLSLVQTRMISLVVLLPTVFLPIKKLAYTSLVGIVACICLVMIVLYDGLSKSEKPGSILDPMETEFFPAHPSPLSFGLIMSGFAGHAVFPSIYRDMDNPKQYNRMVNVTYVITIVIYFLMAVIGYLMFGPTTLQEITQNVAAIQEYSQALNRFAIWLLVLTPIAKYGLMLQPLNLSWEIWLLNQPRIETFLKLHQQSDNWRKAALLVIGRSAVTLGLVYIALIFPGFDQVMSLLGALFSFTISVIFPLVCHLALFKGQLSVSETVLNWLLLAAAACMAILGTIWSLFPSL